MDFQEQKNRQLERKDKSNEQKWDSAIRGLCDKINSKKQYYTTSSCSGRIILVKGKDQKSRNAFLFKSHEKVSFNEFKKIISKIDYKKLVYFKQEPVILHIACSDISKAEDLLDKARDAGWKKKGIITARKRFVVELIGSEKLELPIMNNKKLLVDDAYLKLLLKEANLRLGRTWERIFKLEKKI